VSRAGSDHRLDQGPLPNLGSVLLADFTELEHGGGDAAVRAAPTADEHPAEMIMTAPMSPTSQERGVFICTSVNSRSRNPQPGRGRAHSP
jgi:hypothetical protein